MTLRLNESERDQQEWNRKARDATNGLIRRLAGCGPTAERPPKAVMGQMYYDTSLSKPVWRDTAGKWRDAGGTIS